MTQNKDMKICLAGKNEIAIYGLKLLLELIDKNNIYVLPNSNDTGIDTWQPSLLKAARDNKLQIVSLEECYTLQNIIFLSLEFDKIIIPQKFSKARLYNIHFSNLPSYKGMFTSSLPLINGETESGVTLHEIDSGIDTGDIIDQIIFKISHVDTARDLYFLYLKYSKKLLKNNLKKILKNDITSHPQSSKGSSYYSVKVIDFKNLKVKLFSTAEQIKNQIRAYTFPEFQVPKIHNYFVNSAEILKTRSTKSSGTIISVNSNYISISTIDYDLNIRRDKNFELFEAASNNNLKLARECIDSGASLNKRTGNGQTPIIAAAINGSKEVARLLIENGADVNIPDYEGTTPLMFAMSNYKNTGQRIVFDLLCKSGTNLDLVDINMKSIKDYAKEKNCTELLSLDE